MGPFVTICLINTIFDLFRVGSLVMNGVALLVPLTTLAVSASVILQAYAFYACLQVYKEMIGPFDQGQENRQPFLPPQRNYVSLAAESSGFVPFAGEGRRLG